MKALQKLLARKTNSLSFIPEIDGFRFLAIISVILFHICDFLQNRIFTGKPEIYESSALYWVVEQGQYGVELFFIISGFVLSVPFVMACAKRRPPVALKEYFLRRVTRLEPPYIFNLSVLLVPYALLKGYELSSLLPHYFARVFYAHNLIFPDVELINPVAWSLEIEIQFYLLVPLLARLFAISGAWRRRLTMAAIGLLAIVLQATVIPTNFPRTLASFIQYFLMGFILADIYVNDWDLKPAKSKRWDAAVLAAAICIALSLFFGGIYTKILLPFSVLWLYASFFRAHFMNRAITYSWIPIIGGMCYTIYLYHYQIIYLLGPRAVAWSGSRSFAWSMAVGTVMLLPIILAFSIVLFLLIEKPCMDRHWPARLRDRIFGERLKGFTHD